MILLCYVQYLLRGALHIHHVQEKVVHLIFGHN